MRKINALYFFQYPAPDISTVAASLLGVGDPNDAATLQVWQDVLRISIFFDTFMAHNWTQQSFRAWQSAKYSEGM